MKWNTALYDNAHNFVSKYGEDLLSYLKPKQGETILDLGSGTGDLTEEIFLSGARVIGVDNSAEMILAAKSKFPGIEFHQMDARKLNFEIRFDAIFSNAVLHWIPEKEKVIEQMHLVLKENGRIVLEFGGKGNIQEMEKAMRSVLKKRGYHKNANIAFWYFPSIAEYSTELEKRNFHVIHAEHFDRITPLKGDQGIKDWFLMFGVNFFDGIPDLERDDILNEVQLSLKATHFREGVWNADYKRIRIVAIKTF
ncbi:MAG TPA: methyltransferase domain-containing protein [Puia sp.]